jgi:hypothetical protein
MSVWVVWIYAFFVLIILIVERINCCMWVVWSVSVPLQKSHRLPAAAIPRSARGLQVQAVHPTFEVAHGALHKCKCAARPGRNELLKV